MSDYLRTTRTCTPAQLKPELLQALRGYAAQHSLGSVEAESTLCVETHSEKKKKRFFATLGGGDPDPFHDTALLLTPAWIIWARSGPKSGVAVSAARLREAQVTAFESQLVPDSGLEVQSPLAGSAEPVVAFVPLGPESATAITAQVRAAIPEETEAQRLKDILTIINLAMIECMTGGSPQPFRPLIKIYGTRFEFTDAEIDRALGDMANFLKLMTR